MSEEVTEGLGRRDVLKRGAILGGAVIWTTPVVQSLGSPAFAATSPSGGNCLLQACLGPVPGTCSPVCFRAESPACCREAERISAITDPLDKGAAILLFFASACAAELTPDLCPS